jgi:hypothetical protein
VLSIRLLFVCAAIAYAQDPFEIHVYEYEPLARGSYTYEAHLNYVLKGTTAFEGSVAPTRDQLHFTSEVTAGLGGPFAAGFMFLTARRPNNPLEYAGWRVLPHWYAPQSWHWPINVGLVTEFSFQRTTYEENSRRVEIRPILEKHFGRLELDANPVFERALAGPGVNEGWSFEPAGRIGLRASKKLTPSLEYYSSWGSLGNLPPLRDQFHQLIPGGDLKLSDRLLWSFGVGVSTTGTGSRMVLKSRFEFSFDRGGP